jgi:hypothetical protein
MTPERPIVRLLVAGALAAVAAGCTGGDGTDRSDGIEAATGSVPGRQPFAGIALPPANGGFDYQLGGGYDPLPDVRVLVRDRLDRADPERFTICYVNGFQTQPVDAQLWLGQHTDVVVRDGNGEVVTDPDWPDEMILDTSTPASREVIAGVVGGWIDQCAADGFEAIEIDNLDTFTRFGDELTENDAVALARAFTDRSHAAGLAIAQKNTAELLARRAETGFDFAVVEECNAFEECDLFVDAYGDQVYVIEYDRPAFERGCREFPQLSIVLRDRDVSPPGSDAHVRDWC